jgi:beta-lactamase class A
MTQSRRAFIAASGAAALGAVPLVMSAPAAAATPAAAAPPAGGAALGRHVLEHFAGLPGIVGVKVVAPAANGDGGFTVSSNASRQMFVGSAIKTFVLCETLRRDDGPGVVSALSNRSLDLNASVWNLDSATLNPPNLIGQISHRTTLEAMINHSDNTATDMSIKAVGIGKIRAFVASAGLHKTLLPESTRSFFGYLLGAPDFKTFTWAEVGAAANSPIVNPPLNNVQTLASSADDLVSYYSRSLLGKFFQHPQTLTEFHRILSFGDAIYLLPLPLGVSAFVKGGSIDVPGFHCLCVPGGMFFDDRWVFFSIMINWFSKAGTDPSTVAAFIEAASAALAQVKGALERK